jgi:hypothetical protein
MCDEDRDPGRSRIGTLADMADLLSGYKYPQGYMDDKRLWDDDTNAR